jgi:hypothetical protein
MGSVLAYLPIVVGVGVGLWYPPAFLIKAVRAAPDRGTDRNSLLEAFLVAVLALLFAWLWVPWQVVPPLVWAALVGVVAYATLCTALVWRTLPWATGPRPGRQLLSTVVGGAAIAAVFVVVLR